MKKITLFGQMVGICKMQIICSSVELPENFGSSLLSMTLSSYSVGTYVRMKVETGKGYTLILSAKPMVAYKDKS